MDRSINFIDLQHQKHFACKDNICNDLDLKNKKIPIVARVAFDDVITHNFKLESTLSHKDLLITSELKMVEDIGLDAKKVHKILYKIKESAHDNLTLVESFAIDIEEFKKRYKKPLSKTKYIDFLVAPFLSFETLYTNNVLDKKNDLFIIIDEDEAFSTFYKEGKYITSKKALCISDMCDELLKINITITPSSLKELLVEKGLDQNRYHPNEIDIFNYLTQTFENFISKLHSISLHNRNVYGLNSVDRIFFSLSGNIIPGIDIYISKYFNESTISNLTHINNTHTTILNDFAASYALDEIEKNSNQYNFTFFEKQPPFYKTEVGKFALTSAALVLAMGAYPLYQQKIILSLQNQNNSLSEELSVARSSTKRLKKRFTTLKNELANIKKQKVQVDKDYDKLQRVAQTLLRLKSDDRKFTKMFLTINDLLKKYHLSVSSVKQSGEGTLDFEIYSTNEKRDNIAKFMESLLDMGYSSVNSGEIKQINNLYTSIITVKR